MTEIEIVRIAVAPANASVLKAPISEWRRDYFIGGTGDAAEQARKR
jgi:hypothetical protein